MPAMGERIDGFLEGVSGSGVKRALLALFFFLAVFLTFTTPIETEDFWWHLNTGRWMWEHGSLPTEDPFLYTTSDAYRDREAVLLQNYWLSQSAYYALYRAFGFNGPIAFNAALFSLIFFVLWRILRSHGVEFYSSFVLVLPPLILAQAFDEVRPQNFSILFSLVVFHIVERYLSARERPSLLPQTRPRSLLPLLPVIMLLWANLHTGFILGIAIMSCLIAAEAASGLLRKERRQYPWPSLRALGLWATAAAFFTLVNPNHYRALSYGHEVTSAIITRFEEVVEFKSVLSYSHYTGDYTFFALLAFLALVTAAFIASGGRDIKLRHVALYLAVAWHGFSTSRYSVFFALFSIAISGGYAATLIKKHRRDLVLPAALVFFVFTGFLAASAVGRSSLVRGPLDMGAVPAEAAAFVEDNALPQPLYNSLNVGGYLSWRLYPEYRVFNDARFIDIGVLERQLEASATSLERLLKDYDIRTVFLTIRDESVDILLEMLRDPAWRPVYLDSKALIFVRDDDAQALPSLDREGIMRFFNSQGI